MIDNPRIRQLNNLLDLFLEYSSVPEAYTRTARELTLQSEKEGFIDAALTMLITKDMPFNKRTLLSCMVKDFFKYCFSMINQDHMNRYYLMLCEVVKKQGAHHKPLFQNIAESLSIFYINYVGKSEEMSLSIYLEPFSAKDDPTYYMYFFKIMEYCASEVQSQNLVLQQSYRDNAKTIIVNQQLFILEVLEEKAKEIWNDRRFDKEVLICCFEWWIEIKFNSQIMRALPQLFIFQGIMESLTDDQIADNAISCLETIVDLLSEEDFSTYDYMLGQMPNILKLAEEQLKVGAPDIAELLIGLVANFGIKFAPHFVQTYNHDLHQGFLVPLLKFFSTEIEKIVEFLINFSKTIITSALQANAKGLLNPSLKIASLIILLYLLEVTTYPSDLFQKLDFYQEHKLSNRFSLAEVIYRNRQESVPLFERISQLLGHENYLKKVIEIISHIEKDPNFFGKLEACLFSLICPLRELDKMNEDVAMLVNTYEEVAIETGTPSFLQRTFLRLFRSIFSIPGRDSDLVKSLFHYTSVCFSNPHLFETAGRTFYRGCEDNPRLMHEYIDDIYKIVEMYPNEQYIARGFIQIACSNQETAYVDKCLQVIYEKIIDNEVSFSLKKQCLCNLSAVIKELISFEFEGKIETVKEFTKKAWPFIIGTLEEPKSKNDDEDILIEKVVKLVKIIMRLLKTEFKQFLSSLFETVNSAFSKFPICSYVYLVEITVTVFHNSPGGPEYLAKLYQSFSTLAFNHLKIPQNLQKYGYLVDDFLGMSGRLIFYNASIIIGSQQFQSLLKFVSEDCLMTNSLKVNKATYNFLSELFMIFWSEQLKQDYNQEDNDFAAPIFSGSQQSYNQIRNFLVSKMKDIICHMLAQLRQIPSEIAKEKILDALISEVKAFPEKNYEIWQKPLQQIEPDVLVDEEKLKILMRFKKCQELSAQNKDLREIIKLIYKDLELIYGRMVASEKRKRYKINFK